MLYLSDAVTKEEVEKFLDDLDRNAEKAPDMLGLIFAMIAIGTQLDLFPRSGYRRITGAVEEDRKVSDCYRKALHQFLNLRILVLMSPLQSRPACKLYEMLLS